MNEPILYDSSSLLNAETLQENYDILLNNDRELVGKLPNSYLNGNSFQTNLSNYVLDSEQKGYIDDTVKLGGIVTYKNSTYSTYGNSNENTKVFPLVNNEFTTSGTISYINYTFYPLISNQYYVKDTGSDSLVDYYSHNELTMRLNMEIDIENEDPNPIFLNMKIYKDDISGIFPLSYLKNPKKINNFDINYVFNNTDLNTDVPWSRTSFGMNDSANADTLRSFKLDSIIVESYLSNIKVIPLSPIILEEVKYK